MNINLHIERLVLDGIELERGQESLLQASVEAELSRMLSADGLSTHLMSGGAMPRLQAGDVQLSADGNSQQLGQQIARAVYGGIGR